MNIIIKPNKEINISEIDATLQKAFNDHDKIIFVFDLTETTIFNINVLVKILPLLKKYDKEIEEKLEKSYIILEQSWKKMILLVFFTIHKPKKPFEIKRLRTKTMV
mgnify:CR=1 FL=1|tara:strand:- start:441 stop:758 length:318 start_codon:yes stop_codon:yes gene_type:complete